MPAEDNPGHPGLEILSVSRLWIEDRRKGVDVTLRVLSRLAKRYRQCSVFVLPSGQEGFGIVFLEAMRFAKPCVGGSPGGTPEIVEDGTTGFIVPFGNEHSLEAALERLLSDADLRRRMGEA